MSIDSQVQSSAARSTPTHPYPAVIVVADEHSSRIFLRAGRGMPLTEKTEYADTADLSEHGARKPESLVRTGGRPRIKPRSERSREELEEFLKHVAGRVNEAMDIERGAALAIIAPPLILSQLRDYIDARTRTKLVCESCADAVRFTLAEADAAAACLNI